MPFPRCSARQTKTSGSPVPALTYSAANSLLLCCCQLLRWSLLVRCSQRRVELVNSWPYMDWMEAWLIPLAKVGDNNSATKQAAIMRFAIFSSDGNGFFSWHDLKPGKWMEKDLLSLLREHQQLDVTSWQMLQHLQGSACVFSPLKSTIKAQSLEELTVEPR